MYLQSCGAQVSSNSRRWALLHASAKYREYDERFDFDLNAISFCKSLLFPTFLQHILSEPEEVTAMSGQKIALKMSVDYISFSAHVDYKQCSEFVRAMKPPHVVSCIAFSIIISLAFGVLAQSIPFVVKEIRVLFPVRLQFPPCTQHIAESRRSFTCTSEYNKCGTIIA